MESIRAWASSRLRWGPQPHRPNTATLPPSTTHRHHSNHRGGLPRKAFQFRQSEAQFLLQFPKVVSPKGTQGGGLERDRVSPILPQQAALGPPDKASKQELTRSNKLLSNYYISEQRLKNKTAKNHETTSSGLIYVQWSSVRQICEVLCKNFDKSINSRISTNPKDKNEEKYIKAHHGEIAYNQ